MYKIKQTPEDFQVKEQTNLKIIKNGKYFIYNLKKTNMTTIEAIKKITEITKTKQTSIGYAGLKDKKAITTQLNSLPKKIKEIKTKTLELTYQGTSNQQLNPGMLTSNEFKITIRNCETEKIKPLKQFINYFDEQRFSENNIEIGKLIIKKNFEKAIKIISQKENIPLEKNNDYLGQLLQHKKDYLKLYINSYQSYLWNQSVKKHIQKNYKTYKIKTNYDTLIIPKENIKQETIPIPGFSKSNEKNEEILKQEKITKRDFIIKQIPYLSQEGGQRNIITQPENFQILKKEKNTITIKFTLEKGSYATMLIKQLLPQPK